MFLALVFLCLSPLRVMGEARAIAILDDLIMAGGVLLIGTILAASGVKFLSQTDLLGASRTLLDKIRETDPSTWTGLSRIIAPLCAAGVKGSEYVMRLSDDLWNKVIGAYKGTIIQDSHIVGYAAPMTFDFDDYAYVLDYWNSCYATTEPYMSLIFNGVKYEIIYSDMHFKLYVDGIFKEDVALNPNRNEQFVGCAIENSMLLSANPRCFELLLRYRINDYRSQNLYRDFDYSPVFYDPPFSVQFPSNIIIDGIATLPDNLIHSIKLPDMPTMADDGTITYPDLPLNPEANLGQVADLPGYSDVATVPLDLPINAETGKVITDIPDVPDVPDIPAVSLGDILAAVNAATSAVGSIADALSQVPTMPSPGDLSLPALVVSKFPFCLPFDAYRLITLLDADPVAPSFEIPFKVGPIDEVMTFDFSYFDKAIQVFRWFEQITFVGALLYATRNFIKW